MNISLPLPACGLVAASALALIGCQQFPGVLRATPTSAARFDATPLAPTNTALAVAGPSLLAAQLRSEPASSDKATRVGALSYSVCAHITTWERPDEEEHIHQLEALSRYGEAIHQNPLKSLLEEFRSSPIVSFTTYGLSARHEPLYFTGAWTAMEAMQPCYSDDQPARISGGEMGEAWLMGYAIADFTWEDGSYVLSVEPAPGLQVVQFERQEQLPALPMRVVAADGADVDVYAGDW